MQQMTRVLLTAHILTIPPKGYGPMEYGSRVEANPISSWL